MDRIKNRFPHLSEADISGIVRLQSETFQRTKNLTPEKANEYVLNVVRKHCNTVYRVRFLNTFFTLIQDDHFKGIAVRGTVLSPIYKEMRRQAAIFKFWVQCDTKNKLLIKS